MKTELSKIAQDLEQDKITEKEALTLLLGLLGVGSSVISQLSEDQQYYITLISRLNTELINEQIITPTQKGQIEKYMIGKMI